MAIIESPTIDDCKQRAHSRLDFCIRHFDRTAGEWLKTGMHQQKPALCVKQQTCMSEHFRRATLDAGAQVLNSTFGMTSNS